MLNQTLFEARANQLYFYSPYNFVRTIKPEVLLSKIEAELQSWQGSNKLVLECGGAVFYVQKLPWDTNFFQINTAKLAYVLHNLEFEQLVSASREFLQAAKQHEIEYLFAEMPPEDVFTSQALNLVGFKLTETRLLYMIDNLRQYDYARFDVRKATENDIPNLRRVASVMRNDFDRFHADPYISVELADQFLSKFVEEAVKGFNDVVLVPNAPGLPSDSFLTANIMRSEWDTLHCKISKMVLSAVSSETNKGWYVKLISEMIYWLRNEGSEVIYLTTQSTNRAVFRTWEKLGFRLGSSTNLFTCLP